jgi:putative endonuclease
MPWVYILRCATGDLYIGMTGDLEQRLKRHNEGTACGFTRHRRPITLAYSEETLTWMDATARERQIKRWTRAKKEALIAGDRQSLHTLSRCRRP